MSPTKMYYRIAGGGYGNRMYSMISAFMVAKLTNSTFYIDWPVIHKYIEMKYISPSSNDETKTMFEEYQKANQVCDMSIEPANTWMYNKTLNISQDFQVPKDCGLYFTSSSSAYFFEIAANLKYAQILARNSQVASETVRKASRVLNDSSVNYRHKLESLYLIGYEFGSYFLNNFWHLKTHLKNRVDEFFAKKFARHFVIGIQFRVEYLVAQDFEAFFRCTHLIESKFKARIGNRSVKWFVSTDDDQSIRGILDEHRDKILMADGKIGHVAERDDAYERALVDIELLSRCDQLILTGGSTFGFIASMKSQTIPFYVEGKSEMTNCEYFRFYAPSRYRVESKSSSYKGYAVF